MREFVTGGKSYLTSPTDEMGTCIVPKRLFKLNGAHEKP